MLKKLFFLFISLLLSFFIFMGCNSNPFVGVGNEVDVTKPSIDVTSHTNGQWVNARFTLKGRASDNIGVETVSIRWIIKKDDGQEEIKKEWNAGISGSTWSKAFTLSGDFANQTGYKTLDIYAFDERGNGANTRILIGVSTDMSVATLTSPRQEILPDTPTFYDTFDWTNFENVEYFFNEELRFEGFTKTQFLPDKSVTLRLFAATDLNTPVYEYTIEDGVNPSADKAEGNTVNWTFIIDSTTLVDGAYFIEIEPEDVAGITWRQSKGYIYINQETDKPQTTITSPGATTFPESIAGGKTYDDDGVGIIYWLIHKTAGTDPVPNNDHTTWMTFYNDNSSDGYNCLSGSIDLSGNQPLLYPWNVDTPKADGPFTVKVVSIDINGKESDLVEYSYEQLSSDQPQIQIVGPPTTATYKEDIIVHVDARGGGSNVKYIYYDVTSDYKSASDVQTLEAGVDFTAASSLDEYITIDTTEFVNDEHHDINFKVWCENEDGNSSNNAFSFFKADNDDPSGEVINPTLKTEAFLDGLDTSNINHIPYFLNQTVTFSGTVEDDFRVASVQLEIFEDPYAVPGNLVKDLSVNTGGPWLFDIDTTTLTDKTKHLVKLTAVDSAGNTSTVDAGYFYVDQDMDKPNAKISSPISGGTMFPNATASGMAWDDDGLDKVYWYIAESGVVVDVNDWENWGDNDETTYKSGVIDSPELDDNPKSFSWNLQTPDGEGDYVIYIRPVDVNGLAAASTVTTAYKQYDSTIPTVQIKSPDAAVNQTGTISVEVQADGNAYDINQIEYILSSTINPAVPGVWESVADVTADSSVTKYISVDTTAYVNDTDTSVHTLTVKVRSRNTNGQYSQTVTYNYQCDNTPPELTFEYPAVDDVINGTREIGGSDSDWSGVKALYISYYTDDTEPPTHSLADIETNSVTTAQADKWFKITNPGTAWTHDYDTTVVESDPVGIKPNFDIYVVAVDQLDNVTRISRRVTIDQDADRPQVFIANPSYTGDIVSPNTSIDVMEMYGSNFLMLGNAKDDDGVDTVELKVYLMEGESTVIYGDGGSSWSTTPAKIGDDTISDDWHLVAELKNQLEPNWSCNFYDLPIIDVDTHPNRYYKVVPRVKDKDGRVEEWNATYFRVSNIVPQVGIVSPSLMDPEVSGLIDIYGTVISNVRDDVYWDNEPGNNSIYLTEDGGLDKKDQIGWSSDFCEDNLDYNLDYGSAEFDGDTTDSTRSDYYRMIFTAKDDERIYEVYVSLDGGISYEKAFYWNGDKNSATGNFEVTDASKYAVRRKNGSPGVYNDYVFADGLLWFFVNIDTTLLGNQATIRIKVLDNNEPSSYEGYSSVQVNMDNTPPTGEVLSWGTSDPDDIRNIKKSNPYIGGIINDTENAIRYVKLFIWDNQAAVGLANDFGGTGSITASGNNLTGSYTVSIPEDYSDIDPLTTDEGPDYWVRAYTYPGNWKIDDIYNQDESKNGQKIEGINTKFGVDPKDGVKLVGVEMTDVAGNKSYEFYEIMFDEFAAEIDQAATDIEWKPMEKENALATVDSAITYTNDLSDPATSVYISNKLTMSGTVRDNDAGDTQKGINRVRVLLTSTDEATTHETWSSETADIGGFAAGDGSAGTDVTWNLTEQDISAYDGDYLLIVEVRDMSGVITEVKQNVHIDSTLPDVTVYHPVTDQLVIGRLNIDGIATESNYDTNPILIEILDASDTSLTSWSVTPSGPVNGTWNEFWTIADTPAYDEVRITFTDKANNKRIHQINVDVDTQPPYYQTYTLAGSTNVTYGTFLGLYNDTAGGFIPDSITDVDLVSGSADFSIEIRDNTVAGTDNITGSTHQVIGELQSDGSTYNSVADNLTPATDDTPTYSVGYGSSYIYAALSDGEYTMQNWIEQNSSKEIYLNKYFIVDSDQPTVTLSSTVSTDCDEDGHIDVGLNAYGDSDPKISGEVWVNFVVEDNYLIDRVEARFNGLNFGSGNNTFHTIASNDYDGTWTFVNDAGNGVQAMLDPAYSAIPSEQKKLNANQNLVRIRLVFDTNMLDSIAALDRLLEIRVVDTAGNVSTTASRQFDVVPYITGIERNSTYNTHRASSGAYPLLQGESNNKIHGFNLDTGDTLTISPNKTGVFGTSYIISGYTVNGDNTEITFQTPANARSGWLRFEVNNVEAVNNLNDNTVSTNMENNISLPETEFWDDDRYIHIWKSEINDYFPGSDYPIYPAMSMDTAGNLYASFSNYSSSKVYYSNIGGSSQEVFYTYDPPEETDIVVTGTGGTLQVNVLYSANYHGGNVASWEAYSGSAGGLYLYDDDAPSIYAGRDNRQIYRFELFYHDQMLQQFKNVRVTRGTNDYTHVSYYDRITNSIKYSYVYSDGYNPPGTDSEHEFKWVNLDGGSDGDDTAAYSNGSSVVLSAGRYEGGISRSLGTDEFSGIAVDEQNLPVVVYLDAGTGEVRLARANNTVPDTDTEWSVQSVLSSGDDNYRLARDYFNAKVDSSGYLHIVFRNTKGELVYVKSTNDPDNGAAYTFGSSVTIDTDGMWADLTLQGTVPYISYMSKINAYDGVKIAYYDGNLNLDDSGVDGDWEHMTSALNYKAGNVRTSIEVHPNLSNSWNVAVGFCPGNLYRVAYYIAKL